MGETIHDAIRSAPTESPLGPAALRKRLHQLAGVVAIQRHRHRHIASARDSNPTSEHPVADRVTERQEIETRTPQTDDRSGEAHPKTEQSRPHAVVPIAHLPKPSHPTARSAEPNALH